MGNHPRIDKLPDRGAVPAASGPGAQRACMCADPPEIPPRSWRAAALDAPRMFALIVAPVDDLRDADVTEDAGDAEDIEDVLAGLLDETFAAAAVRADAAPDKDAAAGTSVAEADAAAAADLADTEPDDDAEGESFEGDGQPGEVVAWGLSFPDRAVIFMHNPLTGQDYFGIFESPERARRFYSAFGQLHLVFV